MSKTIFANYLYKSHVLRDVLCSEHWLHVDLNVWWIASNPLLLCHSIKDLSVSFIIFRVQWLNCLVQITDRPELDLFSVLWVFNHHLAVHVHKRIINILDDMRRWNVCLTVAQNRIYSKLPVWTLVKVLVIILPLLNLFRCLNLEILKEVDKLSLVRLKGSFARKLMQTQFLDDFKDVKLFWKLLTRTNVQEIFSLSFRPQAHAALLVKCVHEPKPSKSVVIGLSRLNFFLYALLF